MAAPEIRLSIGLDLEFFRGQMRKAVNIAQSEFTAQLAVKIDRNKLNTELNNLEKAIKRRTYRIEIGGNLEKAPSKIASLKKALSDLEGTKVEISVGGVASIDAKESRKIRTALRASIMGEGGKILVPTSIVPAITNADVEAFKKAVAGKLSGIKVNVGIQESTSSGQKSVISPEEIGRRAREALGQGLTGQVFSGQAAAQVGKVRGEEARASLVGRLDKASLTKGGYNKAGLEKVITELGGTPSGTVSEMRAQAKKLASSVDDALIDRVWRSVKDLQMNMRYSGGAGYGVGQSISRLVNTMSLVSSDPKAARQQLRSLPPDRITTEMAGRASEQAMANTALGQARAPVGSKFQNSFDKYLNAVVNQAMVDASQARQRFGLRQMGVNLSQKLLPAAGETGGVVRDVQLQSRIAAAQARSAAREASALRESQMYATVAGQVPLGNTAPRLPAGNRGGALALRDTIGRAGMPGRERSGIGGMNIPNLPGAGLVQELGTEFAFAAKQVLLFGTAYKALAFLTSFPQQVGDAVGALQTFRNTLNTISPSAGEAAASSQFILDIVDKYNVPLQSARDGFTKLYASMQPAGFSGNEIRDLFLGISQSAATFGMSADKVDRVNYAFAQMASKGQVMSEELKGQLGDVLPGAMAIFAEAAGFKGPEAIKTFSKALEDGAYKGGAMKALLLNVGTIMRKEFGPGAEGAARTFQGSINRMQNSLKLLYESFEPVAIGFLNSVVMPMTAGLKTVTQGVTAYFKGQRAATPEAENFNKILQILAPSLAGIGKNIAYALQQLLPLAQVVGAVALQVARFLALPFVGYLAGAYLQVMLLTSGFSLLATSGLALATASMVRFIAQGVVAASVMVGLQRATQQTTVATFLFGQTLQTVMIKSVIGIALVAIGALIAKIMELRGQLAAVGGDARAMEDVAKSSAKMGNVEGTKEALGNIKDRLATFKKLQKELKDAKKTSTGGSAFSDRATINAGYEIGLDTARKLIELGVLNENVLTKTSNGYSLLESQMGTVNSLVNENVAEFEKAGQKGNILTDEAIRKNKQLRKQVGLLTIPPGEGAGDAAAKAAERAAKEAERLASEVQRRAIEAANQENALMQINFQKDLELTDAAFDHKKNMLDALHDYEMSGLNDMQARQKKFEKDLKDVQMQRVDAIRKALQKVEEARATTQAAVNVESAAGVPSAPSLPAPAGRGGAFDTGMRTGPSSAIGGSADYHQDIMFGSTVSMKERVQLMDQLARGYEAIGRTIEFSNNAVANERYKSSMSYEAKSSLISRAQAAHANRPRGSGRAAMDYYAPLASQRRSGPSVEGQAMLAPTVEGASYSYGGGGRSGRTMTASRNGAMVYEQLHGSMAVPLQGAAPSRSSTVNTMARRETAEAYDLEKAKAKENASLTIAQLDVQNKVVLAYQQTASIIKQNIDSIYPIEKIKLENKLSKIRNDLQMQGMPEELIAYEEKRVAAMEEGAMAQKVLTDNIADTEAKLKKAQSSAAGDEEAEIKKAAAINSLNGELTLYKQTLDSLPAKQKELNVAMLEGAIATIKNAEALKIQQDAIALVNGSVEGATSSYKGFVKEVMQGGDPTEALKKFQESLSDQVLTIFLDYAFKPVEDFLKDSLKNMLNLPTEEDQRKKAIADAEAQLAHLKTIDANVSTIAGQSPQAGAATPAATTAVPATGGQAAGGPIPLTVIPFGGAESSAMSSTLEGAQSSISKSMEGIASSVEKSSFKLLEGVPPFEQALTIDLPGQVEKSTEALKAKGSTFNESLGKLTQGVGIAIGSIMGIAAGISQVKKGGTGNTLMGIGSILASVGGGIGGFMKLAGANGGTAAGGWKPFPARAFANGGMVKGPTLGLVGEGKYNEAIVPLPDGRSIPVQMRGGPGGGSSRDLLASQSQSRSSPSVLSMSFQSTTINGVEYVDRAQLEMAMAETRRVASRDGAARGANLAIDRLANSPSSRRRAGIR